MQINLTFTCRECGEDQTIRTDTSDYGVLFASVTPGFSEPVVHPAKVLSLGCQACGHVSGELGLGYIFRPEQHAPSHERDRS